MQLFRAAGGNESASTTLILRQAGEGKKPHKMIWAWPSGEFRLAWPLGRI
jgi:hypothetical protein